MAGLGHDLVRVRRRLRLRRRPSGRVRASLLFSSAAAASVVLAACSSSPSTPSASSRSTTTTSGSPSTTTSSSPATTTTSPASPTALAVQGCPTTVALASPPPKVTLPATETVTVPQDEANYLVVFSDDSGVLQMLGPRGWICKAAYGADGSGGLLLQPAGGALATAGTSRHVSSTSSVAAIEGYETGASTVQGAALACPVVPAAASALRQDLGHGCAVNPAGETVLAASADNVAFVDPPGTAGEGSPSGGVNPASGVVLYLPGGGKSAAYLATCTLPAIQQAVCSTVLHHFTSLYG